MVFHLSEFNNNNNKKILLVYSKYQNLWDCITNKVKFNPSYLSLIKKPNLSI